MKTTTIPIALTTIQCIFQILTLHVVAVMIVVFFLLKVWTKKKAKRPLKHCFCCVVHDTFTNSCGLFYCCFLSLSLSLYAKRQQSVIIFLLLFLFIFFLQNISTTLLSTSWFSVCLHCFFFVFPKSTHRWISVFCFCCFC